MFLENPEQIPQIVKTVHFSIFEFPKNQAFPELLKAINISPNDKNTIPIESIHEISELTRTKQSANLTIIINHADRMTSAAENCFLKLLEEPGSNIHFVFFTQLTSALLPTTYSRAQVFRLKSHSKIDSPLTTDPKIISSAKEYISATPLQLATLSQSLAKDRETALAIVDTAIELLYKSYFKTGNSKFLDKLQKLTYTHDNIAKNGHIRLQLVANMI